MLNQAILVGRVWDMDATDYIIVSVPRSFKNADGEYDNDMIKVTLEGTINSNTREYCHKGDIIGVKGRIRVDDDGMKIVAEKVTFLSSRPRDEENDNEDEDIED